MAISRQRLAGTLLPPALRPMLKAYGLGYLTAIAPRLIGFLRVATRRDLSYETKIGILYNILRTPIEFNRFPATCAILVSGATTLPRILESLFRWVLSSKFQASSIGNVVSLERLRFICTFLSAWFAFDLLNQGNGWARRRAQSRGTLPPFRSETDHPNQHHLPPPGSHLRYAGKTMDFTLFALCRAIDVAVVTAWTSTRSQRKHLEQRAPKLAYSLTSMADPLVFSASAAVIMWSWFYSPYRLPKDYNHWISKAADIDPNLIQLLRLCRQGDIVYGVDTGHGHHLAGLCRKLNLPEEWGDPAKTVPIPCTLYHSGTGKICEVHAMTRFWRSWKFSMRIYLPLQLLSLMRKPSSITTSRLIGLLRGAARSSSFLAAFVSLFYYGVCLARTRLGPKLFSPSTVTPQMWDSGYCVLTGCLACGWSILLEPPGRRQEISFFVAPRALATIVPRVYDKQNQWREQLVFASSVALVLNAVQGRTDHHVRGVFGKILERVMAA